MGLDAHHDSHITKHTSGIRRPPTVKVLTSCETRARERLSLTQLIGTAIGQIMPTSLPRKSAPEELLILILCSSASLAPAAAASCWTRARLKLERLGRFECRFDRHTHRERARVLVKVPPSCGGRADGEPRPECPSQTCQLFLAPPLYD